MFWAVSLRKDPVMKRETEYPDTKVNEKVWKTSSHTDLVSVMSMIVISPRPLTSVTGR